MLGGKLAELSSASTVGESMPPWKVLVELLRCLVLATVVAILVSSADLETWTDGLGLGLILWIGFPLVLWTGAMIHESTPWKLAAIHAGDWLVKLLAIGALLSGWAGRPLVGRQAARGTSVLGPAEDHHALRLDSCSSSPPRNSTMSAAV